MSIDNILVFILLAVILIAAYNMGFIKYENRVLFSEVHGVVTMEGKPLSGIEVIQKCHNHREVVRKVLTDENGKFHFKAIRSVLLYPDLFWFVPPSPIVIAQKIFIKNENKEYEAWLHAKSDYVNNSELQGQDLNLAFELTNKVDYIGSAPKGNRPYSICRIQ